MVNRWAKSTGGKVGLVAVMICLLAFAVRAVVGFIHGGLPSSINERTYICSDTGQTFVHKDAVGDNIPLKSPYTGQMTAYPAEACYWNKDGTFKDQPTWVLLNTWIGKPEPTFCPDCDRLVVGHNPRAQAGMKPPPTEAEYNAGR